MNDYILKTLIKPALDNLLEKINQNNGQDIYTIIIVFLIIVIACITFLTWLFASIKINKERRKVDEDRKAKQIENYNSLKSVRKEYEEYFKIIELASDDIVSAFKENNINIIKNKIIEYRQFIFHDLLLSFDEYQKIYEIVNDGQQSKFIQLYENEYKNLLKTITSVVEILNMPELLQKANLEKYIINEYTINTIYQFTNSHFCKFDIKRRIENYKIKKCLLYNGKKANA